jgi:hypothetical protein
MAEQKLNDAVTKMMESLDRKVLRDFQVTKGTREGY